MKLIIGGAWQGKRSYALQLAHNDFKGREERKPENEFEVAEGKKDSYETAYSCRIIHNFQEYVRRLLKEEKDPEEFLTEIINRNPGVIITMNELGCGIVPADPFDRQWREGSGRIAVKIAKQSSEVYRLVCAIPTQIK